jgi:hypothetical protein
MTVSNEERKHMIDILKKFQGDDNDANEWKYEIPSDVTANLDAELGSDDDDDDISPEELKALENVVDSASVEQLWRMLDPEEQKGFLELLEKEGLP